MRLKSNRDFLLRLCLGLLYCGQTCCVSLQIKNRHEMYVDYKPGDVWKGMITFGRGHSSENRNLENEGTRNDGKGQVAKDVQADAPSGSLVGAQNIGDWSSSKAAWARMRPTVQCTSDLMKFSAQGSGFSYLQLDRAGTPLSLSQLPLDCGYSIYKTLIGFVFVAPYDGCDVIKKDGSHLLQMIWQGNPVTLSCPMSQASQSLNDPLLENVQTTLAPPTKMPPTSTKPSQVQDLHQLMNFPPVTPPMSEEVSSFPHNPQPAEQQWMHPYFIYPGYYNSLPVKDSSAPTAAPTTAAAPTTEATSTAAKVPPQSQQQQWMHPYFMYPGYYNPLPVKDPSAPTAAPTTAAAPTTKATSTAAKVPPQSQQQQQWMHPYFIYPGYYNPLPVKDPSAPTAAPTTAAAPTTKATSTAAKVPPQSQQQQQWLHPYFIYPGYYNPLPVKDPSAPTAAPTTVAAPTTEATSTAAKVPPQSQQQQWMNPYFMYPGYYNPLPVKDPSAPTAAPTAAPTTVAAPTTEATSTAVKVPPQSQQQQWMHPYFMYPGYYNPLPVKDPSTPTAAPTTAAAPTTEATSTAAKVPPQSQQQQHWMHPYFMYPGYYNPLPVKDPSTPTAAPTTAAVPATEATSTASKVPSQSQQQQQWMHPYFIYPGYYNPLPVKDSSAPTAAPTTAATSTAAKVPPQSQQQQQQLMQQYWNPGYYNPQAFKDPSETTTVPATTATPTAAKVPPQSQQQQQFLNTYQFFNPYVFTPPQPVKDPVYTTAPTTTPSEQPTTKCPGKKPTSATMPSQSQEVDMYYKDPFKPFFVQFLNPSDLNKPKAKTKSWTQVFSHNYPFMNFERNPNPQNPMKDQAITPK
ncbi:hypothetical protein ACEWY4_007173 [Coilia grayii]|uniref:Uncharacterized protein n=1 Tax=Coilia grayii TaxID=363190 RepID=A0ABD1KG49_9TELE